MLASPSLDFVGAGLIFGFIGLLIFMAFVTVIEGTVLRSAGWRPPQRPFLDAFIMNVVSIILGALFLTPISQWVSQVLMDELSTFIWVMAISCVISIIAEAITLILLRKASWRSVIRPVILANIASYTLIFILLYATGSSGLFWFAPSSSRAYHLGLL